MSVRTCASSESLRARWILALSLFAWLPQAAHAQTTASDKAVAETLFDRGLQSMRAGNFAEACSQLEQSQAIERGIGTLLYLAECYEKLGRTASAWAMFREASSAARAEGQSDRAKMGTMRADRLEPQLSKLAIHVQAVSTTPGLMVLRNGQAVSPGIWGLTVPTDPGEQRVEARAPGRNPWSTTVQLPPNGASVSVDVPELSAAPGSASPAPATPGETVVNEPAAPPAALETRPAPPAEPPPSANTWQKPTGLVIGGVGVVGIAIGSYFGARAISKNNDAEDACPNRVCGSPDARKLDDQAHSAAGLANGFVIGGAALLVGGLVLFFTAPSEESLQVRVRGDARMAGIELGGRL